MKHINLTTVVASFLLFTGNTVLSQPQEAPLHPSIIGTGIFHGETPPLRDIPPMIAAEFNLMKAKAEKKALNKKLESCSYPFAATALPKGPDQAWQNFMGRPVGQRLRSSISGGCLKSVLTEPPDCIIS